MDESRRDFIISSLSVEETKEIAKRMVNALTFPESSQGILDAQIKSIQQKYEAMFDEYSDENYTKGVEGYRSDLSDLVTAIIEFITAEKLFDLSDEVLRAELREEAINEVIEAYEYIQKGFE